MTGMLQFIFVPPPPPIFFFHANLKQGAEKLHTYTHAYETLTEHQ